MEALEQALIKARLDHELDIERYQKIISEHESDKFNMAI